MDVEIPAAFDEFDDYDLWGVSPETLLLANAGMHTNSSHAESALRRAYDIEVVRTNFDLDWETYRDFLETVCTAWFEEPIGEAAVCADAETAQQYVVGAAYQTSGAVMRCLRQGVDQLRQTDEGESIVVPARDLRSIADESAIRLLRALGVVRRTTQGYEYDTGVLEALRIGADYSRPEAAWVLTERLRIRLGVESAAVSEALLASANFSLPSERPSISEASLPLCLTRSDLSEFVTTLLSEDFTARIQELQESFGAKRSRMVQALQFGMGSDSVTPVEWPIPEAAAVVCATASQQNRPVVVDYLVGQLKKDQFTIHSTLRDAGLEVMLENGLLEFEEAYSAPSSAEKPVTEYRQWITGQLSDLNTKAQGLSELKHRLSEGWTRQRQALMESIIHRLDNFRVSPTTFVFSMLDPNYLDDYQVDQYVGDSALLSDEVRQIKNWRDEQPEDAETFSNIVSEVCHYPLQDDETESVLRIMSPWMNFAVQDYTSTFRHLLEHDVTIRLLFRLPSPRGWNNLKQNLLTRLGDTEGNLELRTYTRFKEFHDHTEIKEIKQNDEKYIGETGIHAKLFIAGTPEDGSVVAGSANLMENSFFYNPEAGLQTHDPNVLETTINYYDFIWRLSEPDRIDESAFTSKTNFSFYPKVYRP
ncbi:hypothetical protein HKK80_10580 [Halonotius sp. F2-221B]|uniref:hypothetical protein n=1 Tax=Halonotius sp. F2-221B TaxID=2731620 RepID=UPI00398A6B94